jgi:integrase
MHPKIETWLAEAAQFKSERTFINCRRAWQRFSDWSEASGRRDFDPARLTTEEVQAWQEWLSEQYAPKTVNLWLSCLSRFLAESGYGVLRFTRPRDRAVKPVREIDLDQLLASIDQPRDRALVLLFAGAGLRVGEVLAMRVGDWAGEELTVRGSHARRIKLAPEVREALRSHLEAHPAKDEPEAWVWLKSNGKRIGSPSGIYRLLNRWAGEAGLGQVSAEDLRRVFKERYLVEHPNDVEGMDRYLKG